MRPFVLTLLLLSPLAGTAPTAAQEIDNAPKVILSGIPFTLTVKGTAAASGWYEVRSAAGTVLASGTVADGESVTTAELSLESSDALPLQVLVGDLTAEVDMTLVPGWYSLLPPIIAIAMALLFKEVITSLLLGVWVGALAIAGFNPFTAVWRVIDTYAVPALGDVDGGKTQIVVFSLLLGGMVGMISRNGGTKGIVDAVTPFAQTARRGKLATWLAGLAIFFDDYANTLLVGNTMRPITDRLKISREKLAYIVDCTAAPVAAMVPISTWVGYEISLIATGLTAAGAQSGLDPAVAGMLADASPFTFFIQTIPYLFYPLLALVFVLLTSVMDRDFGPMAVAERRAAEGRGLFREGAQLAVDTSGDLMEPKDGTKPRWWNAGIPVLTVILVVLIGLYTTGRASEGPDASLMDIFGAADPFATLLWGSFAGCIVATVLSRAQGILTVSESVEAGVSGMKAMLIAMVILVLAWSLGAVTGELQTAQYLSQILSDRLPIVALPALVFVTAAAIAFSTGTSWTTMAILIPLVLPLTVTLATGAGLAVEAIHGILVATTAGVLSGSIFGDHCSPISDTTVLSSMGSACDHLDHVRTQMPYALVVAAVALVIGSVGTSLGLPVWVALIMGVGVLIALLRTWGTSVEAA